VQNGYVVGERYQGVVTASGRHRGQAVLDLVVNSVITAVQR
jgi:hypothetical protein